MRDMMSIHHKHFVFETKAEGDDVDVPAAIREMQTAFEEKVAGFKTELKSANDRADALEAKMNRPGFVERSKDEPTPESKAFAMALRCGRESLGPDEIKALVTSNDTAGGIFAPPDFVTDVIDNLVQISPVRNAARVGQTTAPSVRIPKRLQNLTSYWVGETQLRSPTQPTYGQVEIPIAECACYVDISNQLYEDSAVDINAELAFDFAQEFGRLEGNSFVLGTGISMPTGFLSAGTGIPTVPGAASLTTLSAESFSDNLIAGFYNLPSAYRNRGAWMMNSATMGVVRTIKDTTGRYIWVEGIAADQPPLLLGRPVIDVPDMPPIGPNSLSIAFGDFNSGYRIYDRVGLMVLRDPFTQATNGLTRFHARRRVGGTVVLAEAMRLFQFPAS